MHLEIVQYKPRESQGFCRIYALLNWSKSVRKTMDQVSESFAVGIGCYLQDLFHLSAICGHQPLKGLFCPLMLTFAWVKSCKAILRPFSKTVLHSRFLGKIIGRFRDSRVSPWPTNIMVLNIKKLARMSSVLLCIKLSSSSAFVLQDSSKLSSASTVCLASSWDGHNTRPRGHSQLIKLIHDSSCKAKIM